MVETLSAFRRESIFSSSHYAQHKITSSKSMKNVYKADNCAIMYKEQCIDGQAAAWTDTDTKPRHMLISLSLSLQGDSEEFSSLITLVRGSNRHRLFQTGKIRPPWNCVIQSSTQSMSITGDPNPLSSVQMSTIWSRQPIKIKSRVKQPNAVSMDDCLHVIYCPVTVNWFVDCLAFIVQYEIILELGKHVKFLFLLNQGWVRILSHTNPISNIWPALFLTDRLTEAILMFQCLKKRLALLIVAQWHMQHAESALWSTEISTAAGEMLITVLGWRTDRCSRHIVANTHWDSNKNKIKICSHYDRISEYHLQLIQHSAVLHYINIIIILQFTLLHSSCPAEPAWSYHSDQWAPLWFPPGGSCGCSSNWRSCVAASCRFPGQRPEYNIPVHVH